MRKKRSRSTGEHAAVRDALVKKLRATGPYFNPRLKLIASVLEIYPADAENVYTAGKGSAVALIHEAMEIMKLVGHLAPEETHKATVEATMEKMPEAERAAHA